MTDLGDGLDAGMTDTPEVETGQDYDFMDNQEDVQINSTDTTDTNHKDSFIPKRGRGRPVGSLGKPKNVVDDARAKSEALLAVSVNDMIIGIIAPDTPKADPKLRQAYIDAVAEYFDSTGEPLPAWVKLAIIAGAYNIRAASSPTFRTRMMTVFIKARGAWSNFRARRK